MLGGTGAFALGGDEIIPAMLLQRIITLRLERVRSGGAKAPGGRGEQVSESEMATVFDAPTLPGTAFAASAVSSANDSERTDQEKKKHLRRNLPQARDRQPRASLRSR